MMRLSSPSAGVMAKVIGASFEASALASRVSASSDCMTGFLRLLSGARGLGSCYASECRADRHADARRISLAQHVARHHLSRDVKIRARLTAAMHGRLLVHLQPKLGKGHAGPKPVGGEGRFTDGWRPGHLAGRKDLPCR